MNPPLKLHEANEKLITPYLRLRSRNTWLSQYSYCVRLCKQNNPEQFGRAVGHRHATMGHFSDGRRGGTPLPGGAWVSGLQGSTGAGGAAEPVLQQEGGGLSVCRAPTAREEV